MAQIVPKTPSTPEERERIIAAIARWLLTPPELRDPSSIPKLAAHLGIDRTWCYRLSKRLPQDIAAALSDGDQYAMSRYREVVRRVAEDALSGNNKAQKIFFEHIVDHQRKQSGPRRAPIPAIVINALGWLPESRQEQQGLNDSTSQRDTPVLEGHVEKIE